MNRNFVCYFMAVLMHILMADDHEPNIGISWAVELCTMGKTLVLWLYSPQHKPGYKPQAVPARKQPSRAAPS